MTPLEALSRQLWLRAAPRRDPAMWAQIWAWYLDPRNKAYVKASAIGQAVAKAEGVLRLIEAAGLSVDVQSPPRP